MEENVKTTEKKTTSRGKYQYISVGEWISRMRIAFSNAKLPTILPQLQTIGYTEEKLNGYLEKVAALEELNQAQKLEYAVKTTETEKADKKRKEINEIYMRHLAFCRILFKNDTFAAKTLEFAGERKTAFSSWYQQVNNFYAQLLASEVLLEKIKSINIQENDIKAVQSQLEALILLKENQKKEIAEAQKATEIRDQAFDELHPLYSELIAYAKILFQEDQVLEALGVKVKK